MFNFIDVDSRGPSKGWVGNIRKFSKPIDEGFKQEVQ
jgi:hypothetical protein